MSVYSATTNLTSILKKYSSEEREKVKNSILNKVRFEIPKTSSVTQIIEDVLNHRNYIQYQEFISYLKEENQIDDKDLFRIITEARQSIHLLKLDFCELVKTLLSINWITRNDAIIQEYKDFYLTLMIAHNEYTSDCISNLISYWIPDTNDTGHWIKSIPNDMMKKRLNIIHTLLDGILNVIPMSFDIVLECIEKLFPYYKKPSFVIGGYIHNILWLFEYRPIFKELLIQLLLKKLVHLDVNAPRNEIEEFEEDAENIIDNENNCSGIIFEMDECNKEENDTMVHRIAETLDVCMEKLFNYFTKFQTFGTIEITQFFKILLNGFNNVILPSHNTHHVQFLLFYFCSFKPFLAEKFLNHLWSKATNPNMPAPIRQASVGYMASFLARAKFLSLGMLKNYLAEISNWAHQYIQRSDSIQSSNSLKVHIVFYSVCQAIFYIIAFRSKDLTSGKKNLLFLQSLQLSTLVTCNFNPLKVCLPAIATAFAGVTRAYQLAYCHTILERNARRKLATVYANETSMPEEYLDTFFPFDPYLLKKSGKQIEPLYLKYQASEAEEDEEIPIDSPNHARRKRTDSEMNGGDDIDDFIIDKRQRLISESSISDKELQFTYGSSPGFQNI